MRCQVSLGPHSLCLSVCQSARLFLSPSTHTSNNLGTILLYTLGSRTGLRISVAPGQSQTKTINLYDRNTSTVLPLVEQHRTTVECILLSTAWPPITAVLVFSL
ncbi:unnamed protein product [Ectocarpus sp. 12 AP-2014]